MTFRPLLADEGVLREQIWRSLRLNLVKNACFMAERLCAQNSQEENVYILALAYHRFGKPARAREVLKGHQSEQCRYLVAQCCVELGKLSEAEDHLLGGSHASDVDRESYDSSEYQNRVPNGAAGFYLLGHICRASGRKVQAIKHLKTALELNPLLWSAYEDLCQLGAGAEVAEIVSRHASWAGRTSEAEASYGGSAALDREGLYVTPPSSAPLDLDPSAGKASLAPSDRLDYPSSVDRSGAVPLSSNNAPGPSPRNFVTPSPAFGPKPKAPGPADDFVTPENVLHAPPVVKLRQQKGRKINDEGKIRKVSGKLFGDPMQISPPARDAHLGTSTPTPGMLGHKSRARVQAWHKAQATGPGARKEARAAADGGLDLDGPPEGGGDVTSHELSGGDRYQNTLRLIGHLAMGLASNCSFRCFEAIKAFLALPDCHANTPWVQCQLAKANAELVRYETAAQHFQKARSLDRQRLDDLEIYSTVLWHMKKETDLMYLAHELMSIDRLAPQSWCVLGNCFSLQKEHETALQFFQRALQLDPNFTYAHTLCGHEYFANEDFANSMRCYRNAIRIDAQHYNAWYGIGQIYFKQEKHEMTEYHFRRALSINKHSSVLRCCLGKTLHKMGCTEEALQLLDEAVDRDPKNAIAKYERAVVLFSIGHLIEALQELESLKDMAPREPNVFFLLGKTCKRLSRVDQAMAHFSIALDLKPSSADIGLIKAAIEKLRLPDDDAEADL